jgi:L,D-transpeptidase catalytic domain
MSLLRLLALSYLASASVFAMAATFVAHPELARDLVRSAGAVAEMANDDLVQPFLNKGEPEAVARLDLAPPAPVQRPHDVTGQAVVAPPQPRMVQAPDVSAVDPSPPDAITILPDLPQPPPAPKQVARNELPNAAPAFRIPDPPSLDAPVPSRGQLVAARLEAGLTPEMTRNFDLFLYVSKADAGPLSQRLYVFEKQRSGDLKLLYDWAASTGREQHEISPRGEHTTTTTPSGYYELDPDRMYRGYRSYGWDQDMPYAMFFNWEREGLQTGLAIHAATGRDVEKLGARASAGCVHLAPENARILFNLIRKDYRGPVPRFAYDYDSQTMSNQGQLMHDRAGNLKMADGYRVLIRIENYGGSGDTVAALL